MKKNNRHCEQSEAILGMKNHNKTFSWHARGLHAALLFFSLLLTVGCVAPYEDTRREAGQIEPVGQSRKPHLAICYHPFKSTAAEVEACAKAICAESNQEAVFKDRKYFNCTVVAPNTAFFECK